MSPRALIAGGLVRSCKGWGRGRLPEHPWLLQRGALPSLPPSPGACQISGRYNGISRAFPFGWTDSGMGDRAVRECQGA